VHAGHYGVTREPSRRRGCELLANCAKRLAALSTVILVAETDDSEPAGGDRHRYGSKENAPSRWRLRPAFRLTAAEATAYRRAINLGRSVLGACGTLGGHQGSVKPSESELLAICEVFFRHR
jgi:hypothetical protein